MSASIDVMRRWRRGRHSISSPAMIDVPPRPHGLKPEGRVPAAVVVVEVVKTVSVDVAVAFAATVSVVGFKLQVGRYCAPTGEPVRVQVRFIVPEYMLPAVRLTDAVAAPPGEIGAGAGTLIVTGSDWVSGPMETVTALEVDAAKLAVPP